MKDLEKTLIEFVHIFEGLKKEKKIECYALIGGLAVATRGRARTTEDIDFLLSADQVSFEETLPEVLKARGYNVKVFKGKPDDPLKGLIRVYDKKEVTNLVDIIPVFWRWQDDMVKEAEYISLTKGVDIPVVKLEALVVLKLKAGGPRDLLDAEELLKVASEGEGMDKDRLLNFARRAKVDVMLEKILAKLA